MKIKKSKSLTLTQTAAAERMGVTDRTVRRWMGAGKVPYTKLNRAVFIPLEFVERFVKGQHGNA